METNSHVKFEYNQINEQLFLGTNSCCPNHFKAELLEKGVIADISLEGEMLDRPFGVKYFLWLPTTDHTAPTMDALAMGVQMIRFLLSRGMKVYVHCKNGHGRAPTLIAAYFISQGMSPKKAIREIAKKRPEIHIEPIQEARLQDFASSYRW